MRCVLFFSSLIISTLAYTSEYVGTIAAEFRVDESGAATYLIPIELPAGRAEVKPQLNLSYSSRNLSEGLVGVGWNLSAGSAITRCPPTPIEDAAIAPITFTTADKFCLDGQRLNVKTGTIGSSGSTYVLDIDNFALISAQGSSSVAGNPQYFVVKTKSGETHYYGNAQAANASFSGADAYIEPAGSASNSRAKAWLLKAVVDVSGNYIRYQYIEDNLRGISYLNTIEYGGHISGDVPFANVQFSYVENTKGFGGYYYGTAVLNNRRLTTITSNVDGTKYRQYNLAYEASSFIEERTLLTSVEECAPTSATNSALMCKPRTNFSWNRPALATSSSQQVCETEPGFPQFCWQQPTSTSYQPFDQNYQFTSGVSSTDVRVFDIDGDGKDDLIYEQDSRWRVRLASSFSTIRELTSKGVGIGKKENVLVMDANADGVNDLIVAEGEGQNWFRVSYTKGFSEEVMISSLVKAVGFVGKTQTADINGDGREDIVFQQAAQLKVYLQPVAGGSWTTQTLYTFPDNTSNGYFDNNFIRQTGNMKSASSFDINGDGRSDLLMKVTTTSGYCETGPGNTHPLNEPLPISSIPSGIPINNEMADHTMWFRNEERNPDASTSAGLSICVDSGSRYVTTNTTNFQSFVASGTLAAPVLLAPVVFGTSGIKELRPADLNGDGLTDVAYVIDTTWYYRLSSGLGFTAPDNMGFTADDRYNHLTQFVDLNRDGRADVLKATSGTAATVYFSRPNMNVIADAIFVMRGTVAFGSNKQITYGDINGDGKLDMLKQDADRWQAYVNLAIPAEYTIKRFEDGFGVGTDIVYRSMTDSGVYVQKPAHNTLAANTISPRNGGYLVYEAKSDSNTGSQVGVRFAYGDFLLNTQGRGGLGFGLFRATDLQTNIITETRYHQLTTGNTYALVGMPLSTSQKYGAVQISSSTNTLDVKLTDAGGKLPYVKTAVESSYWVDNGGLASRLANTTSTEMTYDGLGNMLTNVSTATGYGDSTQVITTNTSNVFGPSTEQKRLGNLTRNTIITSRSGVSTKRISDFAYRASDNLITSTTVNGDSVTGNYVSTDQRYVGASLKTLFDYDKYGNKTRTCQTTNTSATLPAAGLPVTSDSMRCSETIYHDNAGRYLQAVKNGLGEQTLFDFVTTNTSERGIIDSVLETSDNSIATRSYYDGFGNVSKTDYPDSRLTEVLRSYDTTYGAKYLAQIKDNAAPDVFMYYDKWGREIARRQSYRTVGTSNDSLLVRTTYDTQGRVLSVSEPNSTLVTTSEYERMGRVSRMTYPHGVSENISYAGNRIITTNALGQPRTQRVNGFGETTLSEDSLGNSINFTYDAYGQLLRAGTAFSNATQAVASVYDSWGRKVETVDSNKGTWRYKYNAFGEQTEQTDAKLQVYSFNFDTLGRTIKRYSASEGTTCWGYGSIGQRAAKASGKMVWTGLYTNTNVACSGTATEPPITGLSEFRKTTFDSLGRAISNIARIESETFAHSYVYNTLSQVTKHLMPTGTQTMSVTNAYDINGALMSVKHDQSDVMVWQAQQFNSRGKISLANLGNGLEVRYGYDASGNNTSVGSYHGSTLYHSALVRLDNIFNVDDKRSEYRNTNATYQNFYEDYSYDGLNRLKTRTYSATTGTLPAAFTQTRNFDYDSAGNLTYKSDKGYYKYLSGKPNQLESIHSASTLTTANRLLNFTYDANGSVTSDSQRSFAYTAFDKPRIIQQGSNVITMAYGIDRQMLTKLHQRTEAGSQVITEHAYIGNYERIKKTTGNGITEHKYALAGGQVIITQRSNATTDTHYLHKDTQGSIAMVTDQAKNIVTQALYSPFGEQLILSQASVLSGIIHQPATETGYTGHQQLNSVGIIHMKGRIYDASIGRFLQADPFIQAPTNSQNYNRYSYVMNNPMTYTDPSGYFFSGLRSKIKKYWKPILAIAVTIYTAGAATAWVSTWGATWGTAAVAAGTSTLATAATLTTAGAVVTGAIAGAAGGFIGGALIQGNLKGALKGALTGAIAGAAGGYANFGDVSGFGDAAGRIGVSALGGCGAGKASGGTCRKGARTAALVQALTLGASELYKKISTKTSGQTGQQYNDDGKPHFFQRGQNDVGSQLDADQYSDWLNGILSPEDIGWKFDKSTFMQTAGRGPYMDAFGEFHDGLHDYFFIPDDQFSLILTMPPSYAITIIAAAHPHSSNYYLQFLQDKENQ